MTLERRPGRTLWAQIEESLEADIAAGRLSDGEQLPAEPALMARFRVSRATIRQALASLERRGLVHAEQGRGTFVGPPRRLAYAISERTRFSRNLIEQGFEPSGEVLHEHAIPAGTGIGAALHVPEWQSVLHSRALRRADGLPIAISDKFVPLDRFPNWGQVKARHATDTATFAHYGIRDYRRIATRIAARLPSEPEAALLEQSVTAPVFVLTRIDADLDGRPVMYGCAIWAADRVTFDIADDETAFRALDPERPA